MERVSSARDWEALATDLLLAIDWLERLDGAGAGAGTGRDILISLSDDLRTLQLGWRNAPPHITVLCQPLPKSTDVAQDCGPVKPNASLHRAMCKAAAEMLSWHKDPETYELIETQRYRLFMRWPGEAEEPIEEYAFGLWD